MSLYECFHVPCRLTPQAHVPFLGRSTYHGLRSDPPRTKGVQVHCNSSYSITILKLELQYSPLLIWVGRVGEKKSGYTAFVDEVSLFQAMQETRQRGMPTL